MVVNPTGETASNNVQRRTLWIFIFYENPDSMPGYDCPELEKLLAKSSIPFIRDTPEIMPIALMHLPLFNPEKDFEWCNHKTRKSVPLWRLKPFCNFFIKAAHIHGWTWLLNRDTMSRYTLNGLKFGLVEMWKKQCAQLLYALASGGNEEITGDSDHDDIGSALFYFPDLMVRDAVHWFGDTTGESI
eukprot:TRINITY_DN1181_c0_g1_i1.p1 TRINITY_DN1181_c0_g1~~TRINITY_DN1181_c0_g1_i1.p1  ORF type:complete len:187 (+),score=36.18 TRINITY_DN1181_c0_g1_i1:210-770(+)